MVLCLICVLLGLTSASRAHVCVGVGLGCVADHDASVFSASVVVIKNI